jgi:hypothetical protein
MFTNFKSEVDVRSWPSGLAYLLVTFNDCYRDSISYLAPYLFCRSLFLSVKVFRKPVMSLTC